jgi:hypothetical protein
MIFSFLVRGKACLAIFMRLSLVKQNENNMTLQNFSRKFSIHLAG